MIAGCASSAHETSLPPSRLTRPQVAVVAKIDMKTFGKMTKYSIGPFHYYSSKDFGALGDGWPATVWVADVRGDIAEPSSCPKSPCRVVPTHIMATIFISPDNGQLLRLVSPPVKPLGRRSAG